MVHFHCPMTSGNVRFRLKRYNQKQAFLVVMKIDVTLTLINAYNTGREPSGYHKSAKRASFVRISVLSRWFSYTGRADPKDFDRYRIHIVILLVENLAQKFGFSLPGKMIRNLMSRIRCAKVPDTLKSLSHQLCFFNAFSAFSKSFMALSIDVFISHILISLSVLIST